MEALPLASPVAEPGHTEADVFVSYAHEDVSIAQQLAAALERVGLRVWWDHRLVGGDEFAEVIDHNIRGARITVVLWSRDSVRSSFVLDEAGRARELKKLVPIRIADLPHPLGFGQLHTVDMFTQGDRVEPALLQRTVVEVQRRLGTKAQSKAVDTVAPTRRGWLVGSVSALGVAAAGGGLWFSRSGKSGRDSEAAFAATREGVAALEAHNFQQARLMLNRARQIDREYAPAFYYLAQVLIQTGERDEARKYLEQAVALDSSSEWLDGGQLSSARHFLAALSASVDEPQAIVSPTIDATDAGVPARGDDVPPSLALVGDARAALHARVRQIFANGSEERIAGTTALIADPEVSSDAVPLAIALALDKRAEGLATEPNASGAINTLVLLRAASPATLLLHARLIDPLLQAVRATGPQSTKLAAQVAKLVVASHDAWPVVMVQLANENQRAWASQLSAGLRELGFVVFQAANVAGRAPRSTELRVQGNGDRSIARWLAERVRVRVDAASEVKLLSLRNASPKRDTYELWLGSSSTPAIVP